MRERLIAASERAGDLLAQRRLLGTESMWTSSEEICAFFTERGRSAVGALVGSAEIDELSGELGGQASRAAEVIAGN